MAVIDQIRARYASQRTHVEVPEWGEPDHPLDVYADPFTLADEQTISRFLKDDDPAGFAELVIRKAEDAAGNKLFGKGDKPLLLRTGEARVVKRVAMAIMSGISIEGARKNSGPTPDSSPSTD